MTNFNVEKIQLPDGVQELVIRTGEAKPNPKKATYGGETTHEGLIRFANWRIKNGGLSSRMCVGFDVAQATALFTEGDPSDEILDWKVTASLKVNPVFGELGINTGKLWGINELKMKLLHRAELFEQVSDHEEFIKRLSNINGKINTSFQNADDFKGNTADSKITTLESTVPTTLKLKTWVYSGEEKKVVNVEFRLVVSGSSVLVSMGSTDLNILEEEKRSSILDNYMKQLHEAHGIVVLEK